MAATRIDLGLAPSIRLGGLTLTPATRAIRRDDGAQEVIEPRVMQVLLALADARGEIVRREDLTECCWEGRIVGEDAINRVLSRLRRVAEGIGRGSFRIETITRIGYRLVELGPTIEETATRRSILGLTGPRFGRDEAISIARPTRRAVLAGAAAGSLMLAGGAWWGYGRWPLPASAREAMERGMHAFRLLTLDDLSTAVAAFHQATELAPRAAGPWGSLALAYRWLYWFTHGQEASLNAQRARDAAGKALRLDPDNGDAQATLATLQPQFRNWLAYDAASKTVFARHPDQVGIGLLHIDLMSNVGRIHELNAVTRRLVSRDRSWPWLYSCLVCSNLCLGRLDDADAASDYAFQQWPRHVGTWFTRLLLLTYSGRAAAALAMVEDEEHRPTGLPDWDFNLSAAEARALMTRSKADIDAAAALYWNWAHQAVGVAENAVRFFSAVGRLDDALAILNALYFNRGFDVGNRSFGKEQGLYSERRNRPTWMLWLPSMAGLRADPRTASIIREIGLTDYWRKSGNRPDFPIAGFTAT
ncbi:winged helix-turn-helix domain-containing protein [Sphingomonas sp. PR090111-T3T-6A]|uniref:winged helix-turn-helix domain-containing protein n=1 Tax=Sphingomonas sp. PR090111-T3T-6A TaxID=685778 RepID=UPI0003608152|nr:winged helix-turn-helix domain-containing protein [Sphingomonas sp. PR090111-T3T-6A]